MKLIAHITFVFAALFADYAFAQDNLNVKQISLPEVVQIANQQSPDAVLAKSRFKNDYWQYRIYKSEYRPELSFESTFPDLNRSFSSLTLSDGTDIFVNRSSVFSSTNLSLSQNIGLTGGSIFVNTGLQRIDNIASDKKTTSYLSTPVVIGITQPLFGFNSFRWNNKIEPLKYEEAIRKYIEDMEDVSEKAVNYFFGLYLAQINMEIARINQFNNDTLYRIAQGRYNLGKIAENELLQMELSVLNANNDMEQATLDIETNTFKLKSFLRIKETDKLQLIAPTTLPVFEINIALALEEAKKNRQQVVSFERRMLEARKEIAKTKADGRFNASFFATYGLTQNAQAFSDVYVDPLDQQRFRMGLQIPLIDWGRSKAAIKMAQANYEVIRTSVEQDEIDFEQEVYLKVMEFNLQRNQLKIAEKSDTIGLKRYEVSKQRYLIGKIDITDLNIALKEKDVARQGYVEALRSFWSSYYNIRKLTHYNFEKNEPIIVDTNKLLE